MKEYDDEVMVDEAVDETEIDDDDSEYTAKENAILKGFDEALDDPDEEKRVEEETDF